MTHPFVTSPPTIIEFVGWLEENGEDLSPRMAESFLAINQQALCLPEPELAAAGQQLYSAAVTYLTTTAGRAMEQMDGFSGVTG